MTNPSPRWLLSDGTVVHLGGNVEGTSALAVKLRRDAEHARAGFPPSVLVAPPPGYERLSLDDPWHINCWVRDEAYRMGLRNGPRIEILESPEVKAPAEWDEEWDPDKIY